MNVLYFLFNWLWLENNLYTKLIKSFKFLLYASKFLYINLTVAFSFLDVSPCTSNPCQNEATCVGDEDSYQCFCQPGFVGTNCEISYFNQLIQFGKSHNYHHHHHHHHRHHHHHSRRRRRRRRRHHHHHLNIIIIIAITIIIIFIIIIIRLAMISLGGNPQIMSC